MASVRRNSCLNDVVSVLFHKDLTKIHYLLVNCNELFSLPCSKIVEDNWEETVEYITDRVFGERTKSKTLLKINKVWIPNFPRRNAYHVIFSVQISENIEIKIGTNFKWFTFDNIKEIENQGRLCSPEISVFVWMKEKSFGEAVYKNLKIGGNVNLLSEFTESDFMVCKTDSVPDEYLELLQSASIQMCDQRCIYIEFLIYCFPYLYMNLHMFSRIVMDNMSWEKNDCTALFRSADVSNRNALSFQDFLFILAACSRNTSHTGRPAEIRSKYMFRFFDENSDGLLDYDDFLKLIKYIRIAKKESIDNGSITEDANRYAVALGISPVISMTLIQFVAAVGELKIRGTSAILRFPKSVREFLVSIGTVQGKMANRINCKLEENINGEADSSLNSSEEERNSSQIKEFDISTHTLKIKNYGAAIDIDETWAQHDWVSLSSSQLMKSSKIKSSVERFNQESAPNEIINFLKYFSQPNAADGKLRMSWGSFDMQKFGMCMIVLANSLTEVIKTEPRLLEINSPVYVLGDLHGNFDDLMYFEEIFWPLSPTLNPSNILFLGDYVDRGPNGLEVVAYLFAYKMHNPHSVFLLRGNHEARDVQKVFTFYKECLDKLGPQVGLDVWTSINNVFDVMPLAATIDKRIFCCHGGIPPISICPTLSTINEIPVHLPLPKSQSELAWNLMWNDPIRICDASEQIKLELDVQEGFAHNTARGTGSFFSLVALDAFLKKHKLSHVIRAHEFQKHGVSIQLNGKLLTVFSSSDYCGGRNDSACILLARKKLCIFRLESNANHTN